MYMYIIAALLNVNIISALEKNIKNICSCVGMCVLRFLLS